MRNLRSLTVIAALPLLQSCAAMFYTPVAPAALLVMPIVQPTSNSIDSPSPYAVAEQNPSLVKSLRLGVLANPHRETWDSPAGDLGQVDERADENALLAEHLQSSGMFGSVRLIQGMDDTKDIDFAISCSVDCVYSVRLMKASYMYNWMLLGIGFLIGLPYQDSSASYTADAVFYQRDEKGNLVTCGGTIAHNERVWFCDNIYWRPGFYGSSALAPLFDSITYDFLTGSGCMAASPSGRKTAAAAGSPAPIAATSIGGGQ